MTAAALHRRPAPQALTPPSPTALADALNDALCRAQSRARVESVAIDRLRVKPGEKIVLGATARYICDGRTFRQLMGVRMFPRGVAAARLQKALSGALVASQCGPAVLHLPSLGAVAWLFPNDRKITGATVFADPILFETHVLPALMQAAAPQSTAAAWTLDILRYVPEQGCTVRLDVELADRPDAPLQLIGKCAGDERGRNGLDALRALTGAAGKACAPAPVLYLPSYKLAWQQCAPGAPAPADAYFNDADAHLGRAVRAVARIHDARPPDLPRFDAKVEAAQLTARLAAFRGAANVERALALAVRHAAPPPCGADALLHGDLHFGNFLFDGDKVMVIDFDAARIGSRERDLGGFLACFINSGLLIGAPAETIRAGVAEIIAIYQSAAGPVSRPALAWHAGFALLAERYCRALTRMKPGRAKLLSPVLDYAACAFDGDLIGGGAHV